MTLSSAHIGGFLPLETTGEITGHYHNQSNFLWCGRSSLRWLIQCQRPSLVYLPKYACSSIYTPFREHNVPIEAIDVGTDLKFQELPEVRKGEWLVAINYFGLMTSYINELYSHYGQNLIIDNTQAFFEKSQGLYFNSCRKFFGVADGSYSNFPSVPDNTETSASYVTWEHLELRKQGKQAEAFQLFQQSEKNFSSRLLLGSERSAQMMQRIPYTLVADARRRNFVMLHELLSELNQLQFEMVGDFVPFAYPYMPEVSPNRQKLAQKQLYIPTLWPELLPSPQNGLASRLAEQILPLPVDQNITETQVRIIADLVKNTK